MILPMSLLQNIPYFLLHWQSKVYILEIDMEFRVAYIYNENVLYSFVRGKK